MLYNIVPKNFYAYHVINVEIIKVHAGQILPCGRVTGNKEFTIGGLNNEFNLFHCLVLLHVYTYVDTISICKIGKHKHIDDICIIIHIRYEAQHLILIFHILATKLTYIQPYIHTCIYISSSNSMHV